MNTVSAAKAQMKFSLISVVIYCCSAFVSSTPLPQERGCEKVYFSAMGYFAALLVQATRKAVCPFCQPDLSRCEHPPTGAAGRGGDPARSHRPHPCPPGFPSAELVAGGQRYQIRASYYMKRKRDGLTAVFLRVRAMHSHSPMHSP